MNKKATIVASATVFSVLLAGCSAPNDEVVVTETANPVVETVTVTKKADKPVKTSKSKSTKVRKSSKKSKPPVRKDDGVPSVVEPSAPVVPVEPAPVPNPAPAPAPAPAPKPQPKPEAPKPAPKPQPKPDKPIWDNNIPGATTPSIPPLR